MARKKGNKDLYFKNKVITVNVITGQGIQEAIDMFKPQLELKAYTFQRQRYYAHGDLVTDLIEELYNSMINYDHETYGTLFTTYAWTCINNKIRTWIKENREKGFREVSYYEDGEKNEIDIRVQHIDYDYDREDDHIDKLEVVDLFNYIRSEIRKRKRADDVKKKVLVTLDLLESGFSQKDISKMIGYCHERVNMYIQEIREITDNYYDLHVPPINIDFEIGDEKVVRYIEKRIKMSNCNQNEKSRLIAILHLIASNYSGEDISNMLAYQKVTMNDYIWRIKKFIGDLEYARIN